MTLFTRSVAAALLVAGAAPAAPHRNPAGPSPPVVICHATRGERRLTLVVRYPERGPLLLQPRSMPSRCGWQGSVVPPAHAAIPTLLPSPPPVSLPGRPLTT